MLVKTEILLRQALSSHFHFEINESRLSDTKCLIQDVVSPHCACGDKRMV